MAEQIISPGVFTRENDLSFLPQGIGAIGAAIIGPTEKGPAFVPTVVRSFAEYERRFGPLSSETYVPQTVREYLKNAGSVTVCRILAGGGYTLGTAAGQSNPIGVFLSGSVISGVNGPGKTLVGLLYPSKAASTPSLQFSSIGEHAGATDNDISGSFGIFLSGSNVTTTRFSASLNPSSNDYLFKFLGYTPNNSKDGADSYAGTPAYTYLNFKELQSKVLGTNNLSGYGHGTGSIVLFASMSATPQVYDGIGQTEGYGYSSTPFIQSQIALGQKDLFKFHTLDHGKHLCHEYKISIANLKEPGDIDNVEQYSQFSVLLRRTNDTDKTPLILEQYNNVTLDPNSPRYISRVIGDRYPQYNDTLGKVELLGNYSNISNYIRVEVSNAVDSRATSPKLSPKGFSSVLNPIALGGFFSNDLGDISASFFPTASYEGEQTLESSTTYNAHTSTLPLASGGSYNSKGYLGFKFIDKSSDNENFLQPLPNSAPTNAAGAFSVENFYGHASSSLWTESLSASIDTTGATGPTADQLKFTVPFQGGDDGLAPWTVKKIGSHISATNVYGFDLSTTSKAGYTGYKKALDILSNQDEYDINMLAMPGVIHSLHPLVTNAGIDMVEERGDAFFVMDLNEVDASVNTAVSNVSGIDTNYAAVYYPWVKVLDTALNKPVLVPPSVIVPGAIAASDRIAAEWFAPAGLNRGVLGNVIEAKIRLNQAERDSLYDNKINPIATFPQTGVCIWGQKTLQERSTALDRINVRRLMIALKKFIASSSRYLVFEQNTQATRNRFLNIVNPYLESVQQRQGLYAFRVQMDEANNTPDVIDRNQLVGAIYLQPAKTAEFIVLDFNVLPTGATFDGGGASGGAGGGGGY